MRKSIFKIAKKKILGIRFVPLFLAMALLLCSFSDMTVLAEEITTLTGESTENVTEPSSEQITESEETTKGTIKTESWESSTINGSSDPTLPSRSIEEMMAGTNVAKAENNLYALTVATGIKPGDTVHYFAIRYVDSNGANRTKYLFPHEDAFKISYDYMSSKGGDNTKLKNRHNILNQVGYKITEPSEPKALSAWSVDEYLFKADSGLTSVNSIEVFMTGGSWAVQGMTVSHVTSVAGYGEYGFYSGKYFFGLGKKRISELTKKKSGTLTLSANGDTLINIGGATSSYFTLTAVNEDGSETETPFDDLFTIRLDFADKLDSGIESLIRTSANNLSPVTNDLVEDIAVELEYKDRNGWTRKVAVPVLLSAIGQYVESGDDVKTYGLCQRGDTIAFTGCFPDLSTVVSTKLYLGSAARDLLKSEGGIDFANSAVQRNRSDITKALDSDNVDIAGMSIYKGTCRMSNINDGADSRTGKTYKAASIAYSFSEPAPFGYFTTTSDNGSRINAGSSEKITLKNYDTKDPLIATTNKKHFLVRLHTDTMDRASTKNNIYIRFNYSTSGGERATERFDVKKNVQDFLGYWPTTTSQKTDFAYLYGTKADGTVEFPIELNDVTGITNVEISLGNGDDDWQMAGVSVAYIPDIGPRRVYIRPTSAQGEASPFEIVRTMERADIPPFPLGIMRHFDSNESDSWDVTTGKRTGAVEGFDFSSVRYSMTYDQTQQNLGFVNTAKKYDVMVSVADDSDTSNSNGDSGSDNMFYFQLLFKNGNSAVVLANQQLSSDGFRAGYNESFSISVNRDYGSLTGIRIIPEDVSDDNDIFDKLNISKIVVTEQSNGGAAMQYIIDSVGWIGIDYHDKAEDASIKGREGRKTSEIASKYNVSYQRRVVNLLCEVMTLPWEIQDYLQVEGSISCDLVYTDTDDQPQTISFDVVSRMAQYMNKSGLSYEPPANPDDEKAQYYKNMTTVSDPEWMLRPNHTDRFIMPSIPNLKSLKSITFYATSRNNKPGQWVIGDIAISQIVGDGPVMLTADNEYYRDLETLPLCKMKTDKEKVSMFLPAGAMQSLTLELTDNQLVWDEEESWVSPVTRIPDSTEDTLNVYVYPHESTRVLDGATVSFAVQYAIPFQNPQQSNGTMTPVASGTENACYVAMGIRASGMGTLNNLTLRCMDPSMLFDHAIVQQIREGVVVSNFYINFNKSSALLGVSGKPNNVTGDAEPREQVMYLSFGADTNESTLFAENNDIAVSFKYKSSLDMGAREYYSPFVYLTDAGIRKLYPGLMVEVPFNVPYVTEITGYRIVSFGSVTATVEGALVANYSYSSKTKDENTGEVITNDLTRLGIYSMSDISEGSILVPLQVANTIIEKPVSAVGMIGDNSITPLDITFTTSGALSTGESGTHAPVQISFNYYDFNGAKKYRVISDARKYIQGTEKSFQTGSDTRIRLFLPECKELTSIQILPYDESGTANWSIYSISGTLGFGDYSFNRMVNNMFTQTAVGTIYIKEVTMTTYYALNGGGTQTVNNHQGSVAMKIGEKLNVSVVIPDGTGYNVNVYWIVNDTETDITEATVKDKTGTGFYLLAPDNTSTTPQSYKVVVSSAANPSVQDVITISVSPKNQGSANDIVEQLKKSEEQRQAQPTPTPTPTPTSTPTTPDSGNSGSGGNDPGNDQGNDPGNDP